MIYQLSHTSQVTPYLRLTPTWWSIVLPDRADMVKAAIVFGTPGKNCQGSGLCKVEIIPFDTGDHCFCPKTFAYIGLTKAGKWKISLPKASTSQFVKNTYLSASSFQMEESLQLPEAFCSRLVALHYFIPVGIYTIKQTKKYYTIIFKA